MVEQSCSQYTVNLVQLSGPSRTDCLLLQLNARHGMFSIKYSFVVHWKCIAVNRTSVQMINKNIYYIIKMMTSYL